MERKFETRGDAAPVEEKLTAKDDAEMDKVLFGGGGVNYDPNSVEMKELWSGYSEVKVQK